MYAFTGCSTSHYRERADNQVYGILEEKDEHILGMPLDRDIGTPWSERDPDEISDEEVIGDRRGIQRLEMDMSDALGLAFTNSREYQTRKENLYLSALDLTRQQHEFSPRFFGRSEVSTERTPDGERVGRVSNQIGVDQALQSGARIGASIANDLTEFFTGDPRRSASTLLSLNLVQPLLRGRGAAIVAENLTQAERDVIYEIRDFSRFQQTFSVRIVSSYYRILQQKDVVRNQYNSYQNLTLARERAEALAEDRLPEFQVDQARQSELSARNSYILAVERYQATLDQFKLELGLPLGYEILLNDAPLHDLLEAGLIPVGVGEEESISLAVETRMDLLNEIDRFEDSKRKILVAANQLQPGLNIFASTSLRSDPPTDYASFDFSNYRASAGLSLDLPFDRLAERNAYRSTLIQFERQIRTLALNVDQVKNELRQALRTIDQAQQTYEIQQRSVELAERRVESAELLLEAGRAEIRDQLEAEAALLGARNALTQALINYHIARYEFFRDVGLLETDEEGIWIRQLLAGAPEGIPPTLDIDILPPIDVIAPEELFN